MRLYITYQKEKERKKVDHKQHLGEAKNRSVIVGYQLGHQPEREAGGSSVSRLYVVVVMKRIGEMKYSNYWSSLCKKKIKLHKCSCFST